MLSICFIELGIYRNYRPENKNLILDLLSGHIAKLFYSSLIKYTIFCLSIQSSSLIKYTIPFTLIRIRVKEIYYCILLKSLLCSFTCIYSSLNSILKFHNIAYILKGFTLNHMSSCGIYVLTIWPTECKLYIVLCALLSVIMYFYCSASHSMLISHGRFHAT